MENIIKTVDLEFSYQHEQTDVKVLKKINIEIKKGEFVCVIGHNGSGKSTLAKHFNALLLPVSGKVFIDEMDTLDEVNLWNIRQRAGMVFQNPDNQIVATTVEEDVAFGPENLGVESSEIRKRVDSALKSVEMYEQRKREPHMLSGGQKQRVAIAGVIAMRPDCIVLDEPTAMLDPIGRKEVLSTLKRLNKEENISVVLITHYMEEAVDADRIIVLNNGEIFMQGKPREIFVQVDKIKSIGLDVPQVTELVYELRKDGIEIPDDILSVEECIECFLGKVNYE